MQQVPRTSLMTFPILQQNKHTRNSSTTPSSQSPVPFLELKHGGNSLLWLLLQRSCCEVGHSASLSLGMSLCRLGQHKSRCASRAVACNGGDELSISEALRCSLRTPVPGGKFSSRGIFAHRSALDQSSRSTGVGSAFRARWYKSNSEAYVHLHYKRHY